MLKTSILNPHVNSLPARVRHTNTLVIADRGVPFEPHDEFKQRVPGALGLIRTGDVVQYANIVIESA